MVVISSKNKTIKQELKRLENRLYYIHHQDEVITRTSKYNKEHREIITKRNKDRYHNDPEYREKEIKRAKIDMSFRRSLKGLCHLCFASYVNIKVVKGIPICEECLLKNDS